jgi:hypothetical protein
LIGPTVSPSTGRSSLATGVRMMLGWAGSRAAPLVTAPRPGWLRCWGLRVYVVPLLGHAAHTGWVVATTVELSTKFQPEICGPACVSLLLGLHALVPDGRRSNQRVEATP